MTPLKPPEQDRTQIFHFQMRYKVHGGTIFLVLCAGSHSDLIGRSVLWDEFANRWTPLVSGVDIRLANYGVSLKTIFLVLCAGSHSDLIGRSVLWDEFANRSQAAFGKGNRHSISELWTLFLVLCAGAHSDLIGRSVLWDEYANSKPPLVSGVDIRLVNAGVLVPLFLVLCSGAHSDLIGRYVLWDEFTNRRSLLEFANRRAPLVSGVDIRLVNYGCILKSFTSGLALANT
ncbi:hypothetical protein CDAR_86141 [Caerostris darwini]|uniref:Uncharacterized protein n=1 Tax=Caerostris darwini TaxID=1538125 RepID=A0AAV4SRY3_9ARAC|nr:hypothetical protein CDAR_86141 [Caerostris darwini]